MVINARQRSLIIVGVGDTYRFGKSPLLCSSDRNSEASSACYYPDTGKRKPYTFFV